MRTTVSLLATLVLFATASPAIAVDRQIATKPDSSGQANGYLRAWRFNPSVNWQTWISACCHVPDISKPWYTVGRATSDLYAADAAGKHFWPGCQVAWYGANDQRSTTGFFYTFVHVNC